MRKFEPYISLSRGLGKGCTRRVACKKEARSLYQRANENPYQLGLLHERGRVLAHIVHDQHGGGAPEGGLALAGHQQWVHERLRVVAPDADQQAVNQPPDHALAGVDARYHLHMRTASCKHVSPAGEGWRGVMR